MDVAAEDHAPEARRPQTASQRWTTFVACLLLLLGLLAMLRNGAHAWNAQTGRNLLVFPSHFLTGVAWFAIGMTGIWCARTAEAARSFLEVAGVLLIAWGVAGWAKDGDPSDVFARNPWLNLGHIVIGAVGIGLALRDARHARTGAAPAPLGPG